MKQLSFGFTDPVTSTTAPPSSTGKIVKGKSVVAVHEDPAGLAPARQKPRETKTSIETIPVGSDLSQGPNLDDLLAADPNSQKLNLDQPRGRSRRRALERQLSQFIDEKVQVVMHDNRRIMISSRRRKGQLIVRLHHMFLKADPRVLRAVARFAKKPDSWSKKVVNDFIESHDHLISAANPHRIRTAKTFKFHNLNSIFSKLNATYFDAQVDARIGYGEAGKPRHRRRRSILLGSYDPSERYITVHPALDQAQVPRVYVEYVVFHEMLHQIFPSHREAGRTIFHGPKFRNAERRFKGRREALLWFRENEDTVLRFREGSR